MALWRSPDLVRGGDSVLTEHGEEYASALAEWVDKEVMGRWDGFTDRNIPYDGIYPYEINMEYITDELYSPDIYKWIICSSIYIYPHEQTGGLWYFYGDMMVLQAQGIWMDMNEYGLWIDYGLIMEYECIWLIGISGEIWWDVFHQLDSGVSENGVYIPIGAVFW